MDNTGTITLIVNNIPNTITPTITPTPTYINEFTYDSVNNRWESSINTTGISGSVDYTISATGYPIKQITLNTNDGGTINLDFEKTITKISDGTDTYVIKDEEAREILETKQDTLVSGVNIKTINNESLLGSGNIVINSSIDEDTITLNDDDELQTVGIINPNTETSLKVWNGTEEEWKKGEVKDTYYKWENRDYINGKLPIDYGVRNLCYNNNVCVGTIYQSNNANGAIYSEDGINWKQTLSTTYRLFDICYGDGKFVATFDPDVSNLVYSEDGINWKGINLNINISYICYGNGVFVATSNSSSSTGYYSYDLINWHEISFPLTDRWQCISYCNDKFIAFAYNSISQAMYSYDGIHWEIMTLPASGYYNKAIYGNGIYLTATYANDTRVLFSTDGIHWETTYVPSGACKNYAFGNNKFFIGTDYTPIYYSYDCINWESIEDVTIRKGPFAYAFDRLIVTPYNYTDLYDFVSIGFNDVYTLDENPTTESTVYDNIDVESELTITSVDTTNNTITLSDEKVYLSDISVNTYYTIGDIHSNYLSNIDNVGVKIGNTDISNLGLLHDNNTIVKNENNNLQVEGIINQNTGASLKVWNGTEEEWNKAGVKDTYHAWEYYTKSSSTISNTLVDIVYGNGMFMRYNSSKIEYSKGGEIWVEKNIPVSNPRRLIFGKKEFIIMGNTGVKYSKDGEEWSEIEFFNNKSIQNGIYGDNKYLMFEYNSNKLYLSTDLISWKEITLPYVGSYECMSYGNGIFVTVLYNSSHVLYSNDGINWNESSIESGYWSCMTFDGNKFIVSGGYSNYFSVDGSSWVKLGRQFYGVKYHNGKYIGLIPSPSGNSIYYSYDLSKWTAISNSQMNGVSGRFHTFGDDKYIALSTSDSRSYLINFNDVYTLDINPTTESQVYSQPGIESELTITSVDTTNNTITLSDTNTYNKGWDINDYYTLADLHPDYLANINNVGIKLGNTNIANVNPIMWNGTKSQWEDNEKAIWYNWEGNSTLSWENMYDTTSSSWYSVAYGKGTYVAIHDGNTGIYSKDDGKTWHSTQLPTSHSYNRICYGNGVFVAITISSTVQYVAVSEDGINWTSYDTALPVSVYYSSICYGNGKFVIFGGSDTIVAAYSEDGINWTQIDDIPNTGETIRAVTYGNGKFVGISFTHYIYSEDGINWSEVQDLPYSNLSVWSNIAYGNGKYVVTGYNCNPQIIIYSEDLVNWTKITVVNLSSIHTSNIAFGNGKFVLTSQSSHYTSYYSDDAINWFPATLSDSSSGILCGTTDKIICLLYDGTIKNAVFGEIPECYLLESVPNTNSVIYSKPNEPTDLMVLSYDSTNNFMKLSDNKIYYHKNTKDINGYKALGLSHNDWIYNIDNDSVRIGTTVIADKTNEDNDTINRNTEGNLQTVGIINPNTETSLKVWNGTEEQWNQAEVKDTYYKWEKVSYGNLSTDYSSIRWGMAYGNGVYVTLGYNSTYAFYSEDGLTWSRTSLPASRYWRNVAFGNGKFIAVAQNSDKWATSDDGITWTELQVPDSRNWWSICYANGKFVALAIGGDKYGLYSEDGKNWQKITLPELPSSSHYYYTLCGGNGKFIATIGNSSSSIYAYSEDGINWVSKTLPITINSHIALFLDNKFFVDTGTLKLLMSEDGIKWNELILPEYGYNLGFCYGDGKLFSLGYNKSFYTYDYKTWNEIPYGTGSQYEHDFMLFNGRSFIATKSETNTSVMYKIDFDNVYTKIEEPTIDTALYSDTNTISELTITSVDTSNNTITLSNNNVYPKESKGNLYTYYNLAEAHPDYLANIDNKGIKIGNTLIADLSIPHDNNTIVKNDEGNLQTVGIINPQTETALKVWNGTEEEWNQGEIKDTYYKWDRLISNTRNLSNSYNWYGCAYGDGKYILTTSNGNKFAYSEDGENWEIDNLPNSRYWRDICYGNDKFVTIANDSNVFAYSENGKQWTEVTLSYSRSWQGICYGNGKFVAVSYNSNTVAYSEDGIHWEYSSLPRTTYWRDVCYGNGKFVAVSENYYIAYSEDGINWSEVTLSNSRSWDCVCYGNGKFVTVDYSSRVCAYSEDGINWSEIGTSIANYTISIAYGDGKFVAVTGSNDYISYSEDGITWYAKNITNISGVNICYGDGKFITAKSSALYCFNVNFDTYYTLDKNPTTESQVYSQPGIESELTITSIDTTNNTITLSDTNTYNKGWTANTYYTVGDLHPDYLANIDNKGIKIGNTLIADLSIPHDNNTIVKNDEGNLQTVGIINPQTETALKVWNGTEEEWNQGEIRDIYTEWYRHDTSNNYDSKMTYVKSIAYGNGVYVSVSSSNGRICYSENGTTWTQISNSFGLNWNSIAYGNGVFVATSTDQTNKIIYSYDGINWDSVTLETSGYRYSVCYGDGKFITVRYGSNEGHYSTDGINWTSFTLPKSREWYYIVYGDNKFEVLMNGGSKLCYSQDGVNDWTEITLPQSYSWSSFAYGNGTYIMTSQYQGWLISDDGINWKTPSTSYSYYKVIFGGDRFIAYPTSNGYYIRYSFDGKKWKSYYGNYATITYTGYGDGKYICLTSDGYYQLLTFASKYTLDKNLTTESTVYDEPYEESELTITSIDTTNDTITLSDSKVYDKKGDYNVYYTIAEAHPDYLANIDNKGVKIGNTLIADLSIPHDNNTIVKNDDNELQTVGIINPQTETALKVWNGTEEEWNQAEVKDTYYKWECNNTIFSSMESNSWNAICYGDGKFIAIGRNKICHSENGIDWHIKTSTIESRWWSVAYGNGKYVIVSFESYNPNTGSSGTTNKALYSEDGIAWTEITLPSYYRWRSVCYGNGKFVAVAYDSSECAYSEDGIHWTMTSMPASGDWYKVCYGNDKFVAINRSYSKGAYSYDGVNWVEMTMPGAYYWGTITYGNGMFVATVNSNGSYSAYSYDGIKWNLGTTPSSQIDRVAYGDGKFVGTTMGSDNYLFITEDGKSWALYNTSSSYYKGDIAFGNGRFVSIPSESYDPKTVMVLTFNSVYTEESTPTTESVVYDEPYKESELTISSVGSGNITLSNNKVYYTKKSIKTYNTIGDLHPDYLANIDNKGVKIGNTDIASSSNEDNITINRDTEGNLQVEGIINPQTETALKVWNGTEEQWNQGEVKDTYYGWVSTAANRYSLGGNSNEIRSIVYGNGIYAVVRRNSPSVISYSTNKSSWTSNSLNGYLYSIAYGNGKFVAVGENIYYSTDCEEWTKVTLSENLTFTSIAYGNGRFVAIGGTKVIYSDDGINWTTTTCSSNANDVWTLTYGNGKFVGFKYNTNICVYSEDGGETWSESTLPYTSAWYSSAYGDGKFVAVNYDSSSQNGYSLAYSEDCIHWIKVGTYPYCIYKIAYGDGKFAIMNTSNTFAYSNDLQNWHKMTLTNSSGSHQYIYYTDNQFITADSNGYIYFINIDTKYTSDKTPTTSSNVYDNPEILSELTITSRNTSENTITLSNGYVYYADDLGYSYYTIADKHSDYIANIDNVGIKIGDTIIAEKNLPVDQTYDAESVNAQSGVAVASAIDNNISSKFVVVDELPLNPIPGVFYFIKE